MSGLALVFLGFLFLYAYLFFMGFLDWVENRNGFLVFSFLNE